MFPLATFALFFTLLICFPQFTQTATTLQAPLISTKKNKTFRLKHVIHMGGSLYPNMVRRKDFDEETLRAHEKATGVKFTHELKANLGIVTKSASEEDKGARVKEIGLLPDVKDKDTLITLAKMTYNAYVDIGDEGWYDLGDKYSLNASYGWQADGLRGHVFLDTDEEILILAIKGTSVGFLGGGGPTVPKDKRNDNRLFSCCCARVGPTWRPVCDCYVEDSLCNQTCLEESVDETKLYIDKAAHVFKNISREYPGVQVWLSGHSLGGSLAALVGLTYYYPVVAFEAPGERLAAARLHLPRPPAYPYEDMNIWHIGHTADSLYMGACNGVGSSCWLAGYALETHCHTGMVIVYDTVSKLNWSLGVRYHRIKDVIERVLETWDEPVPEAAVEEDCVDCGWWEFVDDSELRSRPTCKHRKLSEQ